MGTRTEEQLTGLDLRLELARSVFLFFQISQADLGLAHHLHLTRLDDVELYRGPDQGDLFPEPLFAILNFAKINDSPMTVGEWVMEVDWVKHEAWR